MQGRIKEKWPVYNVVEIETVKDIKGYKEMKQTLKLKKKKTKNK